MSKLKMNPITGRMDMVANGGAGDFPGTLTIGDATDNVVIGGVGGIHFAGNSMPIDMIAYPSDCCTPAHNDQLGFTSLTTSNGIVASNLDQVAGASRVIEVVGMDQGICTKGTLGATYERKNTTFASTLIMIRLSTMYGSDTWDQAGGWEITLDILTGPITGKFTIFMPPFCLLHYSTMEVYATVDGATYLTKTMYGFDSALAGPPAVTEDFLTDETAGTDVVIGLADTTDLYAGNEVFLTDSAGSEWARITDVSLNTSITVATLINSYTTLNGAKVDRPAFIYAAETFPINRGLFKFKAFPAGINSGITVLSSLPQKTDPNSYTAIILNYTPDIDNPSALVTKWRVQYFVTGPTVHIPISIQYGTLAYADIIPPAVTANSVELLTVIPHVSFPGQHGIGVQVVRMGAPGNGDTYTGTIRLIAVAFQGTYDRIGMY